MYLEAKRYVAPYDSQTEPMRRAIGAAIGYVPPKEKPGEDTSLLEVSGVTVRVGYWRKFDALHRWFVNNTQEGHDDCRPSFVSVDTLIELEEQLEQVSDDPASASEYFTADENETLDEGEVDYTLKVLHHAKRLQAQGWDITYRASW
ncbi:hypothetical protein ASD22_11045 [Rhodanobacter sp. Root480]|uniref:hypothetical protein n=1 Tax=Rhodanobacter sp. Root480 TaxID=1736542 RepID=UPI0006FD4BC9|nr:hypothetical protein [Rhodanobacter sp. Root480]KQX98171.1 hypothetical protein ASD22_11045 [Rhodanobacter sp. Root480]